MRARLVMALYVGISLILVAPAVLADDDDNVALTFVAGPVPAERPVPVTGDLDGELTFEFMGLGFTDTGFFRYRITWTVTTFWGAVISADAVGQFVSGDEFKEIGWVTEVVGLPVDDVRVGSRVMAIGSTLEGEVVTIRIFVADDADDDDDSDSD